MLAATGTYNLAVLFTLPATNYRYIFIVLSYFMISCDFVCLKMSLSVSNQYNKKYLVMHEFTYSEPLKNMQNVFIERQSTLYFKSIVFIVFFKMFINCS